MSLWTRIRDSLFGPRDGASEPEDAPIPIAWLPVDDPGNPFSVPILNLMNNLRITSVTSNPAAAECAVSWRAGGHRRLEPQLDGRTVPCALAYRAPGLVEGLLYVPHQMEDKWVIAWRDDRIVLARSWTGLVDVVATARIDGDVLRVSDITLEDDSALRAFGDPVQAFDWLIRTHALGERIPLPCDADGAKMLEQVPLHGFSLFGRHLFCAAVDYEPPASAQVLGSDGDMVRAIHDGDVDQVRRLLAKGHSTRSPAIIGRYPPLHLALAADQPEIVRVLIGAGADVDQPADRDQRPLHIAVVNGRKPALLALLIDAGADLEAPEAKGHRPLHAAAEVGQVAALECLLDRGAELEARTHAGYTPLHIAAALGHLAFVKAAVARGADLSATSDLGTPLETARAEGQTKVAKWLARR